MARAWLEKSRQRGTLSELGYELLHDRVYKATWSSPDVEHFLYLAGGPRGISAGFGIRNPDAEAFAVREILKCFSDDTMARALQLEYDERSSCTMRFGFSLFDPFWSKSARSLSDPNLAVVIQEMVTQKLFPAIREVITVDKFLDLLIADNRPCHWAITNGAIRAGQIVALANKCGMPTAQIRATLEARERWIANGFLKSSPMRKNPSDYIDRIIADWPARAGTET